MTWNLRGYPNYNDWAEARNKRIIDFLKIGRRFKEYEFKVWVYFEQFMTQKTGRWSSFINNFFARLLEELGKRGYIKKFTCVGLKNRVRVWDKTEAETKPLQRQPAEFYTEYEVKVRPTLQALESVIHEITPYLDPAE